jgi:tRNA/tmRNA/rRNA uracil-C5-methylase (TrmA/RlmC/RlmD family)
MTYSDVMKQQQQEGKKRRRRGISGRVTSLNSVDQSSSNNDNSKGRDVESSLLKKIKIGHSQVKNQDEKIVLCDGSSITTDKETNSSNVTTVENRTNNNIEKSKPGRRKRKKSLLNKNDSLISRTKLRNLLKRRAAKKKKLVTLGGVINDQKSMVSEVQELLNENKKENRVDKTSAAPDPSCAYINNPLKAPVVRRAKIFMMNVLKGEFKVTTGPIHHWRTVSKMAVRRAVASSATVQSDTSSLPPLLQIGLFKPKSHDIIPVPNCMAHHPSINRAVPIVQEACRKCNVTAFSEQDGTGQLRYLSINVERSTGAVQITLVWNDNNTTGGSINKNKVVLDTLVQTIIEIAEASLQKIKKEDDELHFKLHSLWVHYHAASKHDNAIFGRDENSWRCVYGPTSISESIDIASSTADHAIRCPYKVTLEFPPNVFRQANIDAFARIIGVIRKRIIRYNAERVTTTTSTTTHTTTKETSLLPSCVELYGGVGTIGLHLVDLVSNLVSSDENPYNVACFQKAASLLPKKLRSRVSYTPKNAAQMACDGILSNSEICIVDPPRKGLDNEVLDALLDHPTTNCFPRLLVYVSCGFPAFERDCNRILQNHKWSLEHAEGFLLFPGSDAIETLAFFVQNK